MKSSMISLFFLFLVTTMGCSSSSPADLSARPYIKKSPVTSFLPPVQNNFPPKAVQVPYIPPINSGPIIVIDPGHGKEDNGHSEGAFHEKYLNLSTSKLLNQYLTQFGYRVIMTRKDDSFPSLEDRSSLANEKRAAVFVSIHYNSAPNVSADGIEIFYYHDNKNNKSRSSKSKQLAQSVLDNVIHFTNAKSRGIKNGNHLAVIRNTDMPAILIEGGFMTNVSEFEKIKTPSYQKSLALGIARGIQEYLPLKN